MSKIAVLLASYNGQKYIREQILSIQSQNDVTVDVFLQDDRSTDDTVKVAMDMLPSDRVRINEYSTGSAANNFFLSILNFENPENYEYFAFADQDDLWLPNKLSKAVRRLKDENGSLYFSNLVIWNLEKDKKTLLKKDFTQKKFDYLFEGGSAGCTYVFTLKFFLQLREKLRTTDYKNWPDFSHDWFTYFFARNSKLKVINSGDTEILYRIHDTNVHGQLNSFSLKNIFRRVQMVQNGWYLSNAENYAKNVKRDSEEFCIYKMYCKNIFTRLKICLQYNFELMRSPKKFFMFLFVSLFFTPYSSKEIYQTIFERNS